MGAVLISGCLRKMLPYLSKMGCQASRVIDTATEPKIRHMLVKSKAKEWKAAGIGGGMHSDFVFSSESDWDDDEFDKMSFDSFSADYTDTLPEQVFPPGYEDHTAYKKELNVFLTQIRMKAKKFRQMVDNRRHELEMTNQERLIAELSGIMHVQQMSLCANSKTHLCL